MGDLALFEVILNSDLYTWVIIPLMIFSARVVDVSLQTLRVIFIARDMKRLAPVVGFFEVLIWLLAIGQIIKNMHNVFCYIAYAGGFATGTYVGMYLEKKLSLGIMIIRVITKDSTYKLTEYLRSAHYGVTSIPANGFSGKVNLLFTIVRRHDLGEILRIINKFNPTAFYSIEDVRRVNEGVFPNRESLYNQTVKNLFQGFRKGK